MTHMYSVQEDEKAKEEEAVGLSFLSLDCAALAESLSSLPLYQRLDLDLDLVQLCEAEDPSSSRDDDDSTKPVTSTLDGVDLTACRRKKYTFDFKPKDLSALRTHEKDNNAFSSEAEDRSKTEGLSTGATSLHDKEFNRPLQENSAAVLLSKTGKDAAAVCSPDDELDKLLESSLSLKQERPEEGGTVASGTRQSSAREQATSQTTEDKKPTDNAELDDMLDELLS